MPIEKLSNFAGLAALFLAAWATTASAQTLGFGPEPNGGDFTNMAEIGPRPSEQLAQYTDPLPPLDQRQADATDLPPDGDNEEKSWSFQYFVGYETFRGIADGSWQNNGIVNGLNVGTKLGALSDYTGIGFQMGGLFGIYDWSGADYRYQDQNQAETQAFVTAGFFRKPQEGSPYSAAVVYDVMLNNNFSVYAQSPALSQWRGQVGYMWDERNEFGLWGTLRDRSANWNVDGQMPTTWRSINEASIFWHYKWTSYGADTTLWVGMPEQDRLTDGGSLGDYLVGAVARVPLNERFNLVAQVTYMHPSAQPGPAASMEDEWSFYIGMTFFPRSDCRTRSVADEGWSPLLPVCDNGTFLVDSSRTY